MRKREPLANLLPEPEAVRRRLDATLREADLLRHLLRLAEGAERCRRQEQGDDRAQ
jgi:hypothetical protein